MLDTQAVLRHVQHGDFPTTWRIFRGKDFRFVQAVLGGAFVFLFVCIILAVIDQRALHQQILFSNFPHISPSFPYAVSGIAVIAVIFGYTAWKKAARQRDSILVLMPEGLVQCTDYRIPEKRAYKTLSYAEVADMALKRIDKSTGSAEAGYVQSVHFDYALDITYKSGQKERWTLDIRFGYPDEMAKTIIDGYEKFHPGKAL
ncbi:MAG TPA: hypothetical protein VHZ51_09540 [Ktedonobacteraceae bacterium]|jgi:hypothetical protein|nr:hypothetical protein [Ktedonobacteraceae bacterium]